MRDRASQFENQAQASSSRSRPLPVPSPRPRSTSPLHFNRDVSPITPYKARRIPVPSTAPGRTAQPVEDPDEASPRRTPPELKRGQGSAKRMIQQWECLPASPQTGDRRPPRPPAMTARVMSREYLDQKPLPTPQATAIPASYQSHNHSPGRNQQYSPARTPYVPSPLQHLQTPINSRKRSATLTPSPSSQSLSPSPGEKRKKGGGRSPLKEMLTVFGGGIQAIGRKARGKGKDKGGGRGSFGAGLRDDSWDEGMNRIGTNGLPGGIVYSDRMGDQEMDGRSSEDPSVSPRIRLPR